MLSGFQVSVKYPGMRNSWLRIGVPCSNLKESARTQREKSCKELQANHSKGTLRTSVSQLVRAFRPTAALIRVSLSGLGCSSF